MNILPPKIVVLLFLVVGVTCKTAHSAPPEALAPVMGKDMIVNLGQGLGLDLVWIPPIKTDGKVSIQQQDTCEGDLRGDLAQGFWIQRYEVTQEQWMYVMESGNPSRLRGKRLPVENISWYDAMRFVRALNSKVVITGFVFRLPCEAEWKHACRAGTTTKYYSGDDEASLGEVAWYSENGLSQTHEVGQKKPNAWGLYDMHGNVFEWVYDGLPGEGYVSRRVKGGCFVFKAHQCEVDADIALNSSMQNALVGLRVVCGTPLLSGSTSFDEDEERQKALLMAETAKLAPDQHAKSANFSVERLDSGRYMIRVMSPYILGDKVIRTNTVKNEVSTGTVSSITFFLDGSLSYTLDDEYYTP